MIQVCYLMQTNTKRELKLIMGWGVEIFDLKDA